MNERVLTSQGKIARLRMNFIAGLPERVSEAQKLFQTLKTNADDKEAVILLHRLFHRIKGVANTFGLPDLGTLAAQGEELANQLLNTVPDAESAFWQELSEGLSQFESCIEAIREANPDAVQDAEISEAKAPRAEATTHPNQKIPGRISVLIVDDDSTVRGVLRVLLRSENYVVLGEASSGMDALVKCSELKPDLVLLDINMPGVDGLQVLASIKLAQPAVKVIMVSGNTAVDKVREAVSMGAAGFVVKPFNAAMVLDRIGSCLKVRK